ncbi:MAG: BamA/TamA family outer membrane protein [Flavobacteriia bacterium]
MSVIKLTYIPLILLVLVSCRSTRYVPEGRYLVKKNKIVLEGEKFDVDDLAEIIRQKPNFKTAGVKLRLAAFNAIDSASVAQKRFKKNIHLREVNLRKTHRQNAINERRILKARAKGDSLYTQRIVPLKDTIEPKFFLREWFKYKIGEAPVVFDSIPFNKSVEQIGAYLKRKGCYKSTVTAKVEYKKHQKAVVHYSVQTGPMFTIDTIRVLCKNTVVSGNFLNYMKKSEEHPLTGKPFDTDLLDAFRDKLARYMRDNALYGFSSSHISFEADTSYQTMKTNLIIFISDRMVRSSTDRDSLIPIKHQNTIINNVYFHIADTIYYKGNFKKYMDLIGRDVMDGQFLRTIDTFRYEEVFKRKENILDPYRKATFYYNGKLAIDPDVIELQSYLEETNYYKEYYLERTYTRMMQLGVFQVIKPELVEIPGTNKLDVHYYLVPASRQSFGLEPRATNSNGFLGVSGSINYINKNLFGGAEKLTFTVSGGFESQPPVFDETLDGEKIKTAGRSFNTFEIGPSLKLDIPGLFPAKVTAMSKRQRPRTVISTAYNYQRRSDFERHIFQLNYLWRFYGGEKGKTQVIQLGLPFASVVKFVRIDKKPDFQAQLDLLNDLFLRNAYSDQFIWQDWKITFEYNNKEKENKGKGSLYLNSTIDPAGNTLSMFKNFQDTVSNGQHAIFGVGYSQFIRMDNDVNGSYPFGKKSSIHGRLQLGAGMPYGNTKTSLPYDYSFFAGGANDNRGWRARALGPGSYKYYLDTNRTVTQIGDIRLGASAEYRFSLGEMLKGAFFLDAGNVWTFNNDEKRVGSQFTSNWFREIAVSAGVGLRFDLDFFIVRVDLGLPISNPALPNGEKWIFTKNRPQFVSEATAAFGANYKQYVPKLFIPVLHFGIGYPF